MRINKYISQSGIASRREADQILAEGRVKVNGAVVYNLSLNVEDGDVVLVLCPHVSIRANRFVLRCSIRNARSDLLRSRRGPKTWCRTGVDKHEEVIQDGPGGRASIRPIGSKGP